MSLYKLTEVTSTADITAPAACMKSDINNVEPTNCIDRNFTPQYLTNTLIISCKYLIEAFYKLSNLKFLHEKNVLLNIQKIYKNLQHLY